MILHKIAFSFPMILLLVWNCQSIEKSTSPKELSAKTKGYHTFIAIKSQYSLPTKRLALRLRIKNISELEEIRNVKILLFPYDKNGLVLIPESRKTPELLCEQKKKIIPSALESCEISEVHYATEVEKIKVHSVTLRFDDGTSHIVDEVDLGELIEWVD